MKFSIVTPSFNQGKYISDTIESVLAQNYPNFEHIIIDGGSSDQTLAILKQYKHLKWVSEKDNGPANAINKGFKQASGEIFCWINSDDYYEPNIFHEVADMFEQKESHTLIFGDLTFIGPDKNVLVRDKTFHINKDYLINTNADVVRQPSSFFSADLFRNVGGLDEKLKLVFDYELFIKMLEIVEPKFVNKNFAYYREYDTTLTKSNIRRQAVELFRVSRKYNGDLFSRLNLTNLKKYLFPRSY